jgi:hypothetical protein
MAGTQLLRRKEIRLPLKMFVNLTTSDNPSFEIAPTVDISCHGRTSGHREKLAAQ